MSTIIILDFGSQYCHLIARRIRAFGIPTEILPTSTPAAELKLRSDIGGFILSGGARSVYEPDAPAFDQGILELGRPVLGICYGHQLIAERSHGTVVAGSNGEYGLTKLHATTTTGLLAGLPAESTVWMNHGDTVQALPEGFQITATTRDCPVAVFEHAEHHLYGVQFHPEVVNTEYGTTILQNFALKMCAITPTLAAVSLIDEIKQEAAEQLGDKKAIIGLSGGIDSSVAALLVNAVIGQRLVAVYVDTGLMRYRETEMLRETFASYNLNLRVVDAHERFFAALQGLTDPEQKRKAVGKTFIEVFDEVATAEQAEVLIQGTIYSDRIESGGSQHASTIKSHHNVGGLPEHMKLTIYEPLRELYKDEVRQIAKDMGLPDSIAKRQVFPGPGLSIRIIGEVTPEKAEIVRQASRIVEEEMQRAGLYDQVWMCFAVLLSTVQSVGIQGDARSYKYPIILRIVESKDAMTATFAKIPYEVLEHISTRITNEVRAVNRVAYDISNKPPATMEWE